MLFLKTVSSLVGSGFDRQLVILKFFGSRPLAGISGVPNGHVVSFSCLATFGILQQVIGIVFRKIIKLMDAESMELFNIFEFRSLWVLVVW